MPDHHDASDDEARLRQQLHALRAEHRDLDQVIDHLERVPPDDQLLVRRLKKRRLALKDRIEHLERQLVPDIPA